MQEFAVHDDDNQFLEIPEDYEIDTENYRYSQDENTTNSRGRILIDLCTALSLRILNELAIETGRYVKPYQNQTKESVHYVKLD